MTFISKSRLSSSHFLCLLLSPFPRLSSSELSVPSFKSYMTNLYLSSPFPRLLFSLSLSSRLSKTTRNENFQKKCTVQLSQAKYSAPHVSSHIYSPEMRVGHWVSAARVKEGMFRCLKNTKEIAYNRTARNFKALPPHFFWKM